MYRMSSHSSSYKICFFILYRITDLNLEFVKIISQGSGINTNKVRLNIGVTQDKASIV